MERSRVLLNCSPRQLEGAFGALARGLADHIDVTDRWRAIRFLVNCEVGSNRTRVSCYQLVVLIGNSQTHTCRIVPADDHVVILGAQDARIDLRHPHSVDELYRVVGNCIDYVISGAKSTGWEEFE